jgi:hypothetical protein
MSDRLAFLRPFLPQVDGPVAYYVGFNRPPASGDGKGKWEQASFGSAEEVAAWLDGAADTGETYVAPAAFAPGMGRTKKAVIGKDWIEADVDAKAMPGKTFEERHANARKLAGAIPVPAVLVDSGGGIQPRIRLPVGDRVQDFADPADGVAHVELLGIALRLYLEDKARELFGIDVKLDHTHGAERVWRVPPGVNCKAADGAKVLTSDRSKWRPVRLVGTVEGLAALTPAKLAFLAPYMNAAQRENAGTAERDHEPPPSAFSVEMLPAKLRKAWPMATGDQSAHDFAVAAALAKGGQPQDFACDAVRQRRSLLPKSEDRTFQNRPVRPLRHPSVGSVSVGPVGSYGNWRVRDRLARAAPVTRLVTLAVRSEPY